MLGPRCGRQTPSLNQNAACALALCPPAQVQAPAFWNLLFTWCFHEAEKPGILTAAKILRKPRNRLERGL